MSEATVRYRDRGLLPGVHDALRCLMATDPGTVWQLPDSEVADALAVLGRARQLLDVAEVSLVREGISRGLPAESSWSVHDWVGISEGQHAPRPAHGRARRRRGGCRDRGGYRHLDPWADRGDRGGVDLRRG